ncbi:tryptophan 7-halogenase [Nisaea acidiphila]|uniref:Tryptophan 7-halogenase n=1 Tax=Nisaea acidiphila TaxID=1862145 RepID=A0A9J7AZV4_9PROT|nr:tryptophan 7-halogenase [Nisaea acidiphila]UUX50981.1 tryptophan 7-halogenase [Nisaea acidiphila]
MIEADIAVVGAGPAGAALALTLAPRHSVLLIDRDATPRQRIGESLIPAARRLLHDMRILDAFEAGGFPGYFGNLSWWGGGDAHITDFLKDPDGPGWHLDRAGFETMLRAAACSRGARLVAPGRLASIERLGGGWRLTLKTGEGGPGEQVRSRLVVDASGRSAIVAKRLGVARRHGDRLTACWMRGTDAEESGVTAGFSMVESTAGGWWYSAPLPGRARVLSFHTDSDLMPPDCRAPGFLQNAAMTLPGVGPALAATDFRSDGPATLTAANSTVLETVAGDGWLAIGDAALSFDPLASRGLFNALYTAWSAAAACHDHLCGDADTFADYRQDLDRIEQFYRRHLAVAYGAENRWPDAPFWSRRRTPQVFAMESRPAEAISPIPAKVGMSGVSANR